MLLKEAKDILKKNGYIIESSDFEDDFKTWTNRIKQIVLELGGDRKTVNVYFKFWSNADVYGNALYEAYENMDDETETAKSILEYLNDTAVSQMDLAFQD